MPERSRATQRPANGEGTPANGDGTPATASVRLRAAPSSQIRGGLRSGIARRSGAPRPRVLLPSPEGTPGASGGSSPRGRAGRRADRDPNGGTRSHGRAHPRGSAIGRGRRPCAAHGAPHRRPSLQSRQTRSKQPKRRRPYGPRTASLLAPLPTTRRRPRRSSAARATTAGLRVEPRGPPRPAPRGGGAPPPRRSGDGRPPRPVGEPARHRRPRPSACFRARGADGVRGGGRRAVRPNGTTRRQRAKRKGREGPQACSAAQEAVARYGSHNGSISARWRSRQR